MHRNWCFSAWLEKGNIVSIHENGGKLILKKVPSVLLLPICGKILEKSILMKCSNFLLKINSFLQVSLVLNSGDSCIKQLLSITHEIYSFFDEGLEVRSIFIDISKAFDKVWHDEIIFKLTQNGISGSLLNLMHDFDLTESLSVNTKLFADDTSLFSVIHDIHTWTLTFNPDTTIKTQEVAFSGKLTKKVHPPLLFDNANITDIFPKTLGNYTWHSVKFWWPSKNGEK